MTPSVYKYRRVIAYECVNDGEAAAAYRRDLDAEAGCKASLCVQDIERRKRLFHAGIEAAFGSKRGLK